MGGKGRGKERRYGVINPMTSPYLNARELVLQALNLEAVFPILLLQFFLQFANTMLEVCRWT